MKRAISIVAVSLAALFVVVTLVAAWLLYTESGTRFAAGRALGALPEGIEVGSVSGTLGSDLQLDGVVIDQPGLLVTVDRLWLRWSALALGDGDLAVAELGASGVDITTRETAETAETAPAEPLSLPDEVSLPLAVAVQRLLVEELRFRSGAEAEPLLVERIEATDLSFVDSELDLDRLAVRAPMLSLDAGLQATAAGDYPLRAELDWIADLQGYAPIDASTELSGSLASLDVTQQVAAPYNLTVSATLANVLDPQSTPSVRGELGIDALELAAVAGSLPAATISVEADVEGPVDALEVRLDAEGSDPQQRRFAAALSTLVSGRAITIRELSVRQPGREGRLTGAGSIALAADVEADLEIDWRSLAWPLTGEEAVRSPRGSISFVGPLQDYRLDLEAALEPVGAPAVDLALAGTGSLEAVELSLEARTDAGTAEGRVTADWSDGVQARMQLDGADLNPAVVAEDWPGKVNLRVAGAASMQGERLEIEVDELEADGSVREQPLRVSALGRYRQQADDRSVDIDRLDARLGANRLELEGSVGERADLGWRLRAEQLAALMPGLSGVVSGSGDVSGPLPRALVNAELDASGLAYDEYRLGELAIRAEVDLAGQQTSTLSVDARQAEAAGATVQELALSASGTAADHQAELSVTADRGDLALALAGRLQDPWGSDPVWYYTLQDGDIAYGDLPAWTLERSEQGVAGAGQLVIGRQCWVADDASLCLGAERAGGSLEGDVDLQGLRFAQLAALLPEGLALEGALDATATLSYAEQGPIAARLDVAAPQGRLEGEVELAPAAAAADAQTSVALENRPLSGRVSVDVPDLGFVAGLAPAVEEVQGAIGGRLQFDGTLAEPAITGSLNLDGGQMAIPQPGLTLTEVAVALEGRGRDGLDLAASAMSGGGSLQMEGRLSPLGEAPAANLSISGEAFKVVDNADARMYLSPDLRIDADAERIDIRGEVHVPRAEITPGARSPSAVTVSEDQVLVSEDGEAEDAPRPIHAEVLLSLGEEVRFEGFGLIAELGGAVEIRQEPESPVTATGEIQIEEGEYRAYGQGLVIEGGRIYFAGGAITQPALDIRAVRRPEEGILVGADVGGTLQEPTFELFSEPAMTQQQQLSWLVLGRSLEETPDGQESALNQAVLAMGLKGGDFLANNIGQQIGLDEVGVQTGSGEAGGPSDPNEASLVVGKYLSPKLYVSYGIGLFDPESVLKLQYELTRNWRVVTESSGEATGADLLYDVEVGN